jgi:hypothetical protein
MQHCAVTMPMLEGLEACSLQLATTFSLIGCRSDL